MSLTSFIWIICAFIGGVYVGVRVARENVRPVLDQQRRTIADNQSMILDGLRRELANIMIRRDPGTTFYEFVARHMLRRSDSAT
jgi:hypothetical protein